MKTRLIIPDTVSHGPLYLESIETSPVRKDPDMGLWLESKLWSAVLGQQMNF